VFSGLSVSIVPVVFMKFLDYHAARIYFEKSYVMVLSIPGYRNKKKLLALLIVILGISLTWRILHPFRQERVERLTFTGKAPAQDTGTEKKSVGTDPAYQQVLLSLFEKPPVHSGKSLSPAFFQKIPGVNLTPPPGFLDGSDETVSPGGEQPANAPESDSTYAAALAQVNAELDRFRVIGFYNSGSDHAIFMQRDKQVFIVRKGDRLDGKYRVEEISADTITLWADAVNDKVHINITRFFMDSEREQLKTEQTEKK